MIRFLHDMPEIHDVPTLILCLVFVAAVLAIIAEYL